MNLFKTIYKTYSSNMTIIIFTNLIRSNRKEHYPCQSKFEDIHAHACKLTHTHTHTHYIYSI